MAKDHIREPSIILFGVQAWPPRSPGDPFHVLSSQEMARRQAEAGPCPVCGEGVQREGEYCCLCDTGSPRLEAQIRAAQVGTGRREKVKEAEAKARQSLKGDNPTVLTEKQRRRIWHGCRSTFDSDEDVVNRAAIARKWLEEIGQLPDWSVRLTRRRYVRA